MLLAAVYYIVPLLVTTQLHVWIVHHRAKLADPPIQAKQD
jgi:hypothetical protein